MDNIRWKQRFENYDKAIGRLNEALTPYLFDVTYYNNLQNKNLKSHIERLGKILFTQADLKLTNIALWINEQEQKREEV